MHDIFRFLRLPASSKVLASPWKFAPHGQCGTEVSELLPHLAEIVDDITLIRSVQTGVNNHGQSIYALNTGRTLAENDLEIREEIARSSARLVANRVAHKLRAREVDELVERLREACP